MISRITLWYREIRQMNKCFKQWCDYENSKDADKTKFMDEMIERFNERIGGKSHLEIVRVLGTEKLDLKMVPDSLIDALWLQFSQAVAGGARPRQCAQCASWFAYGVGVGRRRSAHHCSDRCRKTAWREAQRRKQNG
jgi:hypothetical protein